MSDNYRQLTGYIHSNKVLVCEIPFRANSQSGFPLVI